jgi:outer membrane protein assembly factor BamB
VGVPECPTPVICGGRLYAVRNGGVVTCLDVESGDELFQSRLISGGPYYASPVAGDGKIYMASERGTVSVLSAEATPRVLSSLDLGEKIWATPAVSLGNLFIRSEKHLWRFDAEE